MPDVIIPPGYLQARYILRLAGDPEDMITTLGHRTRPDTTPNEQAENLFDIASAASCPFQAANMYPNWSFIGVDVYIGQDGGPEVIGSHRETITGSRAAADQLPNNCALLVQKRTELAGRRNRGRFFIPPAFLGEAGVNNNGVIATPTLAGYQTNFNAWMAALLTIEGDAYEPVILHSESPSTPTPVTSFVVQPVIATRRRRLRR